MNKTLPDLNFEADLRQAFAVPEADPTFIKKLDETLQIQSTVQPQVKQSQINSRTRTSRWVWGTAVLVVALLMFFFRQPVIASIGRLFGYAYMPEVGFVAVDEVRVLENAVQQIHNGRSVTVTQGLATQYQTSLWLIFSEEARSVDGAVLETAEGNRLELTDWNYSPDEAGTTGVVAYFPPLPESVESVTLILVEGWHLPLRWVSGRESDLTPADVNLVTPVTEEETLLTEAVSGEPCAETNGIKFCVQAVAREGEDLLVLMESSASGSYFAGDGTFSMFTVLDEVFGVTVSDDTGQVFQVASDTAYSQGNQEKLVTTLTFPGAAGLQGPLQITFPAVLVSLPIEEELVVDLGGNPQPGQIIPLDQILEIDGLTVHFSQAVIEGERDIMMTVSIESDPLDDTAPVRIQALEPGRPEGVQDRYGLGISDDGFSVHVQLYQNGEIMTGMLRIPLIKASLKVRGPFILTFDAPQESVESTVEPEVIDDAAFDPLPTGEPLSMEAYQYTGESLRLGDLLSVEVIEGTSWLYAASPEEGFAQRLVAVLPGEVMTVHAHEDLQGLDYITGGREDTGNYRYDQLYTVRFAEGEPVLLVSQFGSNAFEFIWSYDSRFLAYRIMENTPGGQVETSLQILDLACRSMADCTPIPVKASVGNLAWSPVSYQIAFVGESEGFQDSDIWVLSLDPETYTVTKENLTQSNNINDFGTIVWMPSGNQLLYPCDAGLTEINEYSLCGTELDAPGDKVVQQQLPWNMQSIQLIAGDSIVDVLPVMQDGFFRYRVVDPETGESRTLLEWPAEGKYLIETDVSPTGIWMVVYQEMASGLRLVNMESQDQIWVEPIHDGPVYFIGWAP